MPPRAAISLLLGLTLLAGCSTSPLGRKQLTAPAPIAHIHSDIDMHLQLATTANTACLGEECATHHAFNLRVQRLGAELARTAFEAYPELAERIPGFEFVVADKDTPGTASNAKGTVVIFRGVHHLGLDDDALRFLIAREMGHVICQHHEENSSTKILVSVLASVLFPALNLFQGSTVAAQASTATSTSSMSTAMATTAASTITSYLGSRMVIASIKPTQLTEADATALDLLVDTNWDSERTLNALERCTETKGSNPWLADLRQSVSIIRANMLPTIVNAAPDLAELPPLTNQDAEPEEESATLAIDVPTKTPEATLAEAATMSPGPANVPPTPTATVPEDIQNSVMSVTPLSATPIQSPDPTPKARTLTISRKKSLTGKADVANGLPHAKKISPIRKASRKLANKKPAGPPSRRAISTEKKQIRGSR